MIIKNGKIETHMTGYGIFERHRYDVVVKNQGNYVETLVAQCLYETGSTDGATETVTQSIPDIMEYSIYPNMTVDAAITKHGVTGYTWHTPLAEV